METVNLGVGPAGIGGDPLPVHQFQKAWTAGSRPRLDDYLPMDGGSRASLLSALVRVDLAHRLRANDGVRVEEYLSRYPELSADHAAVLTLIADEFKQRRESLAEYQARFPQYAPLLPAALEASTSQPQTALCDTLPPSPSIGGSDTFVGTPSVPGGSPSAGSPPASVDTLAPVPSIGGSDTSAGRPSVSGGPAISPINKESSGLATERGTAADVAAAEARTEYHKAASPALSETSVGAPTGNTTRPLPPPALLGKYPSVAGYDVLDVLGRGGMGVVYKARHIKLKRLVALKMILAGVHADEQDVQRFRAEAEAVARLQHPNIVQIHEIGSQDGQPFFSLEFIDGGSLERRLGGEPALILEAASLIETLANAMHFAHERGVIHRDLKPANILMTKAGEPKITDFGLAKQIDSGHGQTQTGSVMGTPNYMAPEQARGDTRNLGPAADIYSLGAMLFELLTGRPPFMGATVMDTLIQVQNDEPPRPNSLRSLPRDLETICLKCLEKAPSARYATAGALAEDLRRFLNHEPILARPVTVWERGVKWMRRHPAGAACLALLALSTTGALATYGVQTAQEQQRRASTRKRIDEQLLRAQEAEKNQAWTGARDLLLSTAAESQDLPELSDQHAIIQENLERVQRRLQAVACLQKFAQSRDEAIFNATLSGGETDGGNLELTRVSAQKALTLVGVKVPLETAWTPDSAFTSEEAREVREGCYELLLTLADAVVQSAPHAGVETRRERAREGLQVLAGAERLGLNTQAYHLRRARYLGILGDQPAADAETKLASQRPARTARDHYLVGEEYYKRGDVVGARTAFEEALRLAGGDFWSGYFLALCYVKLGQPRLAVEPLNQCLAQKQGLAWIYLLRGFVYGQLGNYKAAEADFSEVLARAPSSNVLYVLHNNRAVMRVGQKKYDDAVADLKEAIRLKPDQYQAYASLAQVEFLRKRVEDAVAAMDHAVKAARLLMDRNAIDPATLSVLYRARSRFHLAGKDAGAALADLDLALALEPADSPALPGLRAERGRLLHRLQRYAEAVVAYKAALQAPRPNPEIHRWMAEALVAAQRYPEAVAALQEFTRDGGMLTIKDYELLALAHHKVGDLRAAIDDLTKLLEQEPDNVPVLGQRGQFYLIVRAYTLASRDFDLAIARSPDDAALYEGRGFALAKLGQHQKAAVDAEEALRRGPRTQRQIYHAARTFAQAAGQIDTERLALDSPAFKVRRSYEERGLALLVEALQKLPVEERSAYWANTVRKDAELEPLRRTAAYANLERTYLARSVGAKP